MASKSNRNAVITGYNSFCLVCESFLRTETDITDHIKGNDHQKNLSSYPYLEKYRNERIRRVKKGYYCEFCNILISTTTKVNLHITEMKHYKKKGTKLLQPLDNTVMAYGDIIINDKAWHSLLDETCAICNTEYDDEDVHKTENTHLLNLVQSTIEFVENKGIYRKIDDGSFQCLTCNILFSLNTMDKHFIDPQHQKLYDDCRNNKETLNNKVKDIDKVINVKKNQQTNTAVTQNVDIDVCTENFEAKMVHKDINYEAEIAISKDRDRENVLNSIVNYQKNEINVNFETEIAFCKKCFKHVEFCFEDIERHIDEHKKNPNKIEHLLSYPSNTGEQYRKIVLFEKTNKEPTTENHSAEAGGNRNQNLLLAIESSHEDYAYEKANNDPKTSKDINSTAEGALSSESNDLYNFAEQHNITYNRNYTFCRICQTKLTSSVKCMKEHVSGKYHKSKAANFVRDEPKVIKEPVKKKEKINSKPANLVRNEPQPRKRLLNGFVNYAVTIKNGINNNESDVVINEQFCVSFLSFLTITKNNSRLRCQLCEVNLFESDIESHSKSGSHRIAMRNTPVVISLKTEFVREIRPGLFHCGYCNLIVENWSNFVNHIKCSEHEENKLYSSYRLRHYMPAVMYYKRQDFLKDMFIRAFITQLI